MCTHCRPQFGEQHRKTGFDVSVDLRLLMTLLNTMEIYDSYDYGFKVTQEKTEWYW